MKAFLSPDWYKLGVEHVPKAILDRKGEMEIQYIPIWQASLLRDDFRCFLPPEYYLDRVTIKVLETIGKYAANHHVRYRFLLLDSIDQEFNEILISSLPDVVDISTPYNEEFTFLPADIHPNVRANQMFYERIRPLIDELDL